MKRKPGLRVVDGEAEAGMDDALPDATMAAKIRDARVPIQRQIGVLLDKEMDQADQRKLGRLLAKDSHLAQQQYELLGLTKALGDVTKARIAQVEILKITGCMDPANISEEDGWDAFQRQALSGPPPVSPTVDMVVQAARDAAKQAKGT